MSIILTNSDVAVWTGTLTQEVESTISGEIPWLRLCEGVDIEDWIDDLFAGIGTDGSVFIEIMLPSGAAVNIEAGCVDGCVDIHSVTVIGDIEPSGLTGCWVSVACQLPVS